MMAATDIAANALKHTDIATVFNRIFPIAQNFNVYDTDGTTPNNDRCTALVPDGLLSSSSK
jgi:hypothetical protein